MMTPDLEVGRLVALYAFALDDRDYPALAAMLAEDCLMVVGEHRVEGRDQIVAAVSGMQAQEPGRHLLGPSVVDILDQQLALAWTDMMGVVPGPDGSQGVAGTWRYHDRVARVGGTWVFTHRYLHTPAQPLLDGAPPVPYSSR